MKNTAMTSQPAIKFRTKFADKIPENLKEDFTKAVHHVNSLSSAVALNLLWRLTYIPENGLAELKLPSIEPVDNSLPFTGPKCIPEELVLPLRNELRYQRTLVDANFAKATISEGIKDAFDSFFDAISQDKIVSKIVLNACAYEVFQFDNEAIERCLFLLNSEDEAFSFGGLRSLGFNYDEAVYLKPYASQIAWLLTAFYDEKKECEKANSPFACLTGMFEGTAGNEEPEQSTEEQPVEPAVQENCDEVSCAEEEQKEIATEVEPEQALTVIAIAANAKIFDDFLGAYNRLKESNFNPEEVISKLDAISKILDGLKVLG